MELVSTTIYAYTIFPCSVRNYNIKMLAGFQKKLYTHPLTIARRIKVFKQCIITALKA